MSEFVVSWMGKIDQQRRKVCLDILMVRGWKFLWANSMDQSAKNLDLIMVLDGIGFLYPNDSIEYVLSSVKRTTK